MQHLKTKGFIISIVLFLLFSCSCTAKYGFVPYTGQSLKEEPYVELNRKNTKIYLWACFKHPISCSLTYSALPCIHNPLPTAIHGELICEYRWEGFITKEKKKKVILPARSSRKYDMTYVTFIDTPGTAEIACYIEYKASNFISYTRAKKSNE